MANPWDNLTEKFDTNKPADEINAAAADNIMVLWPAIINEINKNFPNKGGLTALDFGCGSGGFAEKLAEMGFDVLGVDSSEGMIETSRKNYPDIKFEKDITGEFNLINDKLKHHDGSDEVKFSGDIFFKLYVRVILSRGFYHSF